MAAVILGFQSVIFAAFTKTFIVAEGLHPKGSRMDRWQRFLTLEKGVVTGALLMLVGLAGSFYALRLGFASVRHTGSRSDHARRYPVHNGPNSWISNVAFQFLFECFGDGKEMTSRTSARSRDPFPGSL
jgi:hypothetical protein